MIEVNNLIKILKKNKISFFTGVPDSVLKQLSLFFKDKNKNEHIVAANEGTAVSLGIGYHLATNKLPCIYMQNSGLGNAINPLISISHKKIYSIPMLIIIGWRGSPGSKDEPQHMVKGAITQKLLKLCGIKHLVVNKNQDLKKLTSLIKFSKKNNSPVACLFKMNVFKSNLKPKKIFTKYSIQRNEFIYSFLKEIPKNSKIIATTGFTARELYQTREKNNFIKGDDFYMVGGMGHTSSVGLGMSLKSKKNIFCLDGDGSLLMQMGAIRTIGSFGNKNFKHIMFNNNLHESVGNQTTNADGINFKSLIKSLGYKSYHYLDNKKKIKTKLRSFIKSNGPAFLEVKIKPGTFKKLIRPKNLIEIKKKFKS